MRQSWLVGRALRARRGGQRTARPTFPPPSPTHYGFVHCVSDDGEGQGDTCRAVTSSQEIEFRLDRVSTIHD